MSRSASKVAAAPVRTVNRADVLEAALVNFAENGYQSTTMTDIGNTVGIRGPSLYRHIGSKQELLAEIMVSTMADLLQMQTAAIKAGRTASEKIELFVKGHVIWHSMHRERTFVGNREIRNLEGETKDTVLAMRAKYEGALRKVISAGCASGEFSTTSPRLAAFAILDMGMGIAQWFRADGEFTTEQLADFYAQLALQLLTGPAKR